MPRKSLSLLTVLGATALLVGAAAVYYATSPLAGDIWWSDASGHAMNGAFIHDLLAAAPFHDPAKWAISYYLQFPAVTVLFYPPLFPAIESIIFFLFGVSIPSAYLTVAIFTLVFASGIFALARFSLSRVGAMAAAFLGLAMPDVALWGRQIMLEIPALSLALWSCVCLLHYCRDRRPAFLFAAVVFFCLTLYTKQTFVFLAPVLVGATLLGTGLSFYRRREIWVACVIGGLLILPLVFITLRFGQFNVTLAATGPAATTSALSWASLTWYAVRLPAMAGWFSLVLSVAYLARHRRKATPETVLLVGWFVVGYLFNTFIALKDERYGLHFIVPLAIFAAAFLEQDFPRLFGSLIPKGVWRPVPLLAGLACFAVTLATNPVPRVDGFSEAARTVAATVPKDAVVAFVGHRSGAFIFDVRTLRRDIMVLRPEKLLVTFRQSHDYISGAETVSAADIEDMIRRHQVTYAVVQIPVFWGDIPAMKVLDTVLRSDFEVVRRIPVHATIPLEERELLVMRNTKPVAAERAPMSVDMPLIGQKFSN